MISYFKLEKVVVIKYAIHDSIT